MICLLIMLVLWGGCSYLFSLINANPWFWFLWIPLGLVALVVLFFAWLYLVVVPLATVLPNNNGFKRGYSVHVVKMINILCGAWLKIEGKENLSKDKRVLFVANHKSQLDPCLMYVATGRPCSIAAKSTLWKVAPLRPLMKAYHILKINRENDREAAKSILEGIRLLKEDNAVIIFPEGGIKTREVEQMVSIKPGAYKLATKSEAVIQPMAIIGSSKLAKRKPFQMFKITIRILPPITPEDYKDLNTHEIAMRVVETVNANFKDEDKYEFEEEA